MFANLRIHDGKDVKQFKNFKPAFTRRNGFKKTMLVVIRMTNIIFFHSGILILIFLLGGGVDKFINLILHGGLLETVKRMLVVSMLTY